MSRIVKCGLVQAACELSGDRPIDEIKKYMNDKHVKFVEEAAAKGVQILCFQEIYYGPYFCAEQETKWYGSAEPKDGPSIKLFQALAKKHNMVIVLPYYEEEGTANYYNTAAVIDADGTILGQYRKQHIPHTHPGFWEKFYFKPGNLGYPVFDTKYGKVGANK